MDAHEQMLAGLADVARPSHLGHFIARAPGTTANPRHLTETEVQSRRPWAWSRRWRQRLWCAQRHSLSIQKIDVRHHERSFRRAGEEMTRGLRKTLKDGGPPSIGVGMSSQRSR